MNGSIAQEINIYCTLGDHCTAIFKRNELKSVRFWKSFERSFRWDQPYFFSPQHKKVISNWSWMVHTPKLPTTINTLIWSFFVHFPKWIQFFCWNALVNTYSCQKNQLFWFLSFFTTTSIRRWILANLAPLPPPHGWPLPPIHSTTYLSVFWLH